MTPESDKPPVDSQRVFLLEPSSPTWYNEVDKLRNELGAPDNPYLFPPHFVKKTLISIGGSVVEFIDNGEMAGAGFLFPRNNQDGFDFTLRIHRSPSWSRPLDHDQLTQEAQNEIAKKTGRQVRVLAYIPKDQVFAKGGPVISDGLQILNSSRGDPAKVRELQKEIWGVANDDFLYPVDIHSDGFALATSLLAYSEGVPVGFLFGFDKFDNEILPASLAEVVGNSSVRVESQLMGVLPGSRNQNIGLELKLKQALDARAKGAEIINWTFDPLQSTNAVLNLNKLGGVIFQHYPDYYAFAGANRLNQVVASRFAVTWFVGSPRVVGLISGERMEKNIIDEVVNGNIPIVNPTEEYENNGFEARKIKTVLPGVESQSIAIEIPINWTELQQQSLALAQEWRNITDDLFQRYIGPDNSQYVISSVAVFKEVRTPKRAFLIARPTSSLREIYMEQD